MSSTLNHLVQRYWSKIRPFIKFTATLYLKVNIRLIHFFIETKIGFSLFLFLMIYGLFGCTNSENCKLSHALALYFILYLMSTIVEFWFLVKIPFTRKILDELLTKAYIVKYLGEHTLTKTTVKAFGTAFTILAIESGSSHMETLGHIQKSRGPIDDYYAGLEHSGAKHDPNSRDYRDAIKQRDFHLRQKSEGLFTKTLHNDSIKHAWSQMAKAQTIE